MTKKTGLIALTVCLGFLILVSNNFFESNALDTSDIASDNVALAEKEKGLHEQNSKDGSVEDLEEEDTINEDNSEVVLRRGDTGEEVMELQDYLNKINYYVQVNGVFGQAIEEALLDFKSKYYFLENNSIYTELTKKTLEDEVDSRRVSKPNDLLVLVNKEHFLTDDFVPRNLEYPEIPFSYSKRQLRDDAAKALEKMFEAVKKEGYVLYGVSGYRSYKTQLGLFDRYASKDGIEAANTYSARAGQSEHQTGLAMDISSESVGFKLTTEFGEKPEGIWVKDNSHKYGFIIRYPEDKVDITKYQYEPWHLRYVGVESATEIYEKGLVLEEYLGE